MNLTKTVGELASKVSSYSLVYDGCLKFDRIRKTWEIHMSLFLSEDVVYQ